MHLNSKLHELTSTNDMENEYNMLTLLKETGAEELDKMRKCQKRNSLKICKTDRTKSKKIKYTMYILLNIQSIFRTSEENRLRYIVSRNHAICILRKAHMRSCTYLYD